VLKKRTETSDNYNENKTGFWNLMHEMVSVQIRKKFVCICLQETSLKKICYAWQRFSWQLRTRCHVDGLFTAKSFNSFKTMGHCEFVSALLWKTNFIKECSRENVYNKNDHKHFQTVNKVFCGLLSIRLKWRLRSFTASIFRCIKEILRTPILTWRTALLCETLSFGLVIILLLLQSII